MSDKSASRELHLSVHDRPKIISRMKHEIFDLAIVGGGITGAGVARDAASRGMKVALIEANDFAFGTSSRSSKLIHGGIRYLENYEFHLVFEALSERGLGGSTGGRKESIKTWVLQSAAVPFGGSLDR